MDPKISYETIDKNRLTRLPKYEIPATFHLQTDPGNGCFLDPPGYPTYFTRSVYTPRGDNLQNGPQLLLLGRVVVHSKDWDGCKDWDAYRAKIDKRFLSLYKPLPLDHPRTRAWIKQLYGYFKNCYQDPNKGPKAEDLLIYPVPSYKLRTFRDDPLFSDGWRTAEKRLIEIENREIIEAAEKVAIPENHRAVTFIRQYYPDYQPELDLIEHPPASPGDWWERYDVQFTPVNCPGLHGQKHPASGTWCQMCGFRGELPAPV